MLQFVQLHSCVAVVIETSVVLLVRVWWTNSVSVHVGRNEPRSAVCLPADVVENREK